MINLKRAREIAKQELDSRGGFVIIKEVELEYCYIFYYQHPNFLETGDIRLTYGNLPIYVDKVDGEMDYVGRWYVYDLDKFTIEYSQKKGYV